MVNLEPADVYLKLAEQALKEKSLEDFTENIIITEALLASGGTLLAELYYLKARGWYLFRRYKKSLVAIEEALKYNHNIENRIRLLKYRAFIYAYRGYFDEAINLLKDLLTQTDDYFLLCEIYINLAWANLDYYRTKNNSHLLTEAKYYLDLAFSYFDLLEDRTKKRTILDNLAEYYKLTKKPEKAIEILEQMVVYCDDEDLPKAYNNLAELYLECSKLDKLQRYLHDAKVIATKYENNLEIAKALYTQGMAHRQTHELLLTVDCLVGAFHHFLSAEAYHYAFDCFSKISEVSTGMQLDFVSLLDNAKTKFQNTAYQQHL